MLDLDTNVGLQSENEEENVNLLTNNKQLDNVKNQSKQDDKIPDDSENISQNISSLSKENKEEIDELKKIKEEKNITTCKHALEEFYKTQEYFHKSIEEASNIYSNAQEEIKIALPEDQQDLFHSFLNHYILNLKENPFKKPENFDKLSIEEIIDLTYEVIEKGLCEKVLEEIKKCCLLHDYFNYFLKKYLPDEIIEKYPYLKKLKLELTTLSKKEEGKEGYNGIIAICFQRIMRYGMPIEEAVKALSKIKHPKTGLLKEISNYFSNQAGQANLMKKMDRGNNIRLVSIKLADKKIDNTISKIEIIKKYNSKKPYSSKKMFNNLEEEDIKRIKKHGIKKCIEEYKNDIFTLEKYIVTFYKNIANSANKPCYLTDEYIDHSDAVDSGRGSNSGNTSISSISISNPNDNHKDSNEQELINNQLRPKIENTLHALLGDIPYIDDDTKPDEENQSNQSLVKNNVNHQDSTSGSDNSEEPENEINRSTENMANEEKEPTNNNQLLSNSSDLEEALYGLETLTSTLNSTPFPCSRLGEENQSNSAEKKDITADVVNDHTVVINMPIKKMFTKAVEEFYKNKEDLHSDNENSDIVDSDMGSDLENTGSHSNMESISFSNPAESEKPKNNNDNHQDRISESENSQKSTYNTDNEELKNKINRSTNNMANEASINILSKLDKARRKLEDLTEDNIPYIDDADTEFDELDQSSATEKTNDEIETIAAQNNQDNNTEKTNIADVVDSPTVDQKEEINKIKNDPIITAAKALEEFYKNEEDFHSDMEKICKEYKENIKYIKKIEEIPDELSSIFEYYFSLYEKLAKNPFANHPSIKKSDSSIKENIEFIDKIISNNKNNDEWKKIIAAMESASITLHCEEFIELISIILKKYDFKEKENFKYFLTRLIKFIPIDPEQNKKETGVIILTPLQRLTKCPTTLLKIAENAEKIGIDPKGKIINIVKKMNDINEKLNKKNECYEKILDIYSKIKILDIIDKTNFFLNVKKIIPGYKKRKGIIRKLFSKENNLSIGVRDIRLMQKEKREELIYKLKDEISKLYKDLDDSHLQEDVVKAKINSPPAGLWIELLRLIEDNKPDLCQYLLERHPDVNQTLSPARKRVIFLALAKQIRPKELELTKSKEYENVFSSLFLKKNPQANNFFGKMTQALLDNSDLTFLPKDHSNIIDLFYYKKNESHFNSEYSLKEEKSISDQEKKMINLVTIKTKIPRNDKYQGLIASAALDLINQSTDIEEVLSIISTLENNKQNFLDKKTGLSRWNPSQYQWHDKSESAAWSHLMKAAKNKTLELYNDKDISEETKQKVKLFLGQKRKWPLIGQTQSMRLFKNMNSEKAEKAANAAKKLKNEQDKVKSFFDAYQKTHTGKKGPSR